MSDPSEIPAAQGGRGQPAPNGTVEPRLSEARVSETLTGSTELGKRRGAVHIVSFFLSIALHGLVFAAVLGALSDERLEAPAGGAPLEIDLVVGFLDSTSMQAGVKEPNDAPDETTPLHEEAAPPEEQVASSPPDETPPPPEAPPTPVEAPPAVEEAKAPVPTSAPEAETPPVAQSEAMLPAAETKPENNPPEPPKVTPPPPPPKPKPKAEPRQKAKPVIRKARHEPARKKAESPTPRAQRATRQGDGAVNSRASSRGGSGGATQFAGRAQSASHRAMILAHLARYKLYPSAARSAGIRGRVTIAFRVSAEGAVSGISISRSSGASVLDQATLDMVRRAAPFPRGAKAEAFNVGINYDLR